MPMPWERVEKIYQFEVPNDARRKRANPRHRPYLLANNPEAIADLIEQHAASDLK
jgi:hypothetical protein